MQNRHRARSRPRHGFTAHLRARPYGQMHRQARLDGSNLVRRAQRERAGQVLSPVRQRRAPERPARLTATARGLRAAVYRCSCMRHAHKPGQSAAARTPPPATSIGAGVCSRWSSLVTLIAPRGVGRVRHPRADAAAKRAAERRLPAVRQPPERRRPARGRGQARGRRRRCCRCAARPRPPWPSTPSTTPTPCRSRPAGDRARAAAVSARSWPTSSPAAAACSTTSWRRRRRRRPSTAGLDVGAVPGSTVVSPVDGKVVAIKTYSILGRYADIEIDIQLAGDPSLLLLVTHIVNPRSQVGDAGRGAARPRSGVVRGFPASARPGAQPVHVRHRRPRAARGAARDARAGGPVSRGAAAGPRRRRAP